MKRIAAAVRKKAKKIKLLLLDVDGVLTDGRIVIDDCGRETKNFDVRDGQGIALLMRAGIGVGFITARKSKAVDFRARELGVKIVRQGAKSKSHAYRAIQEEAGIAPAQIAYVGDDILDLAVLDRVGLAITVADGWPQLFPLVDYVTEALGGRGAVREVAELLLKSQSKWELLTGTYRDSP